MITREHLQIWSSPFNYRYQQLNVAFTLQESVRRSRQEVRDINGVRRALTYLAQQNEVDEQCMGIFGISMGGTTVWHVAIDKRIKAACPTYGVGCTDHVLFDEKFDKNKRRPEPSLHQRTVPIIWDYFSLN